MKKFKVYNMNSYFKDGTIVTEKKLRKRLGGWVEAGWNGYVESFNKAFCNWKIVRVKRKFEIIAYGKWWNISEVKIGKQWSKKRLIKGFPTRLTTCRGSLAMTDWDGTLEELNKRLSSIGIIENSNIVFKEVYVEVEDKQNE